MKHSSLKVIRKLYIVLMVLVCFVTNSIPAHAEVFDKTHKGSISLTLRTSVGDVPIEGAMFDAYRVADCDIVAGKLRYILTGDFVKSGIDLTKVGKKETASAAAEFAKKSSTPVASKTTDSLGKLAMDDLEVGLYLVMQTNTLSKYSKVDPFFIAVGIVDGENVTYDSDATPKIEVRSLSGPPKDNKVTPTPSATPSATPGVTNKVTGTPSVTLPILAQTGQDKWQIPVLACIGLGLILSGMMIKTKREEK